MNAQSKDPSNPKSAPANGPEDRGQRWAKYGSNVALMIVLAIVLAGLITYIAQAHPWRADTTSGGVNSLRPQTLNVLHDLKTDIKLVSVYVKAQDVPQTPGAARPVNRAGMVADLLDDYQRADSHISIEVIDPTDTAKLAALQSELDDRYGKGIKAYKDYIGQYDTAVKQLMSLTAGAVDRIGTITVNDKSDQVAPQIQGTLKTIQQSLDNSRADLHRQMTQHRPDYHGITDSLRSVLSKVSDNIKAMNAFFDKNKTNPQVSAAVRDYIAKDRPKLDQIQKLADQQVAQIDKLPDLKVDQLQQSLNIQNPILVLGPTTWRVLSESQVWPENTAAHGGIDPGKLKPTFAGEQQITAAIIGLTSPTKPMVAILRPGGPPLATPGFPPFQEGGPFSDIADRLRLYNFDVVEKDMSGTYAAQAQMHGEQPQPEPSWNDIEKAVWIVVDLGQPIQGQEAIGSQLAAHLAHGGSAMVLMRPYMSPQQAGPDPFRATLATWGIDIHPDMMAVHAEPPPAPNAGTDPLQDFLRRSFVWDVRDYGDAELAKPLKNLESLMLAMCPITTHPVSGHTLEKLLPFPDAPAAPKSWGSKSYMEAMRGSAPVKFDPATDLPGPVYGGAVSQKKDGGRLVVIGGIDFLLNSLLEIPDEAIEHTEGRLVARFPGNAELGMNSIFWCAKMDQMLALSPAALQVSRIGNMGPTTLNFWRVGVLLIFLPGLVLVCGLGMYFARRD